MIVLPVYIVSFGQQYSLGRLLRVLVSNELTASSENTLARWDMPFTSVSKWVLLAYISK